MAKVIDRQQKDYYIGSRYEWKEISALVGRQVPKLTEAFSKHLRTAVRAKGIKKTEQGVRLDFYLVNEKELNLLFNTEARPLVKVDQAKLNEFVNEVNSKVPQRRMDYDTAEKYKRDLAKAVSACVDIIGTDTNERKPREVVGPNPFKVGDWINTQNHYGDNGIGLAFRRLEDEIKSKFNGLHNVILSDAARVYRVSKSSYWLEVPVLNVAPQGVSCWNWAAQRFPNLIKAFGCKDGWNTQDGQDFTIPYEGNEDSMTFVKAKTAIRWRSAGNLTKYQGYRCHWRRGD